MEPLLDNTDTVWVSPVPTRSHDDDSLIDERADVTADSDSGRCRHPFGLYNPPMRVWEAHRRLVLGLGGLCDQEFVDAFAAKNVYCGKGLGQYQSMSGRFKVRRPWCYDKELRTKTIQNIWT